MDIRRPETSSRLAPWNWFREDSGLPARRSEASSDPFFRMRDEMDRLLQDTFRAVGMPSLIDESTSRSEMLLRPSIDIRELADQYEVTAEVPGVNQDDLELTVENDMLMISGEKRSEHEDKGDGLRRVERSYGRFQRVLALPADAKTDEAKASFRNGVLTINVPRDENQAVGGQKIKIESDSSSGSDTTSTIEGTTDTESQTH